MKYILIQNDGEIEANSFELIGASTKRNQVGKIGFFGSGLKYSIAYMMRNNISFKIFSGLQEIAFSTQSATLKDQQFDRICINGKPTSFTVSMGPTWKEDWFVLREVYCNALDEEGCVVVKDIENPQPSEGKTRIFIQVTQAVEKVCANWDAYFAEDRNPLFITAPVYTSYLGHEDAVSHHQPVRVYRKTEGVLYRKGVRVYTRETFMYDYDCAAVNINEDRTAKNHDGLRYAVRGIFTQFSDESYIKSVLRTGTDEKQSFEYGSLYSFEFEHTWSDKWIEFSNKNLLVLKEISGRYVEEINSSRKEVFLIPSLFAKALKKYLPEVKIAGLGSIVDDESLCEVPPTPKMTFLLKEVVRSLDEMGYSVPFDIKVAEFIDDNVLGHADTANKIIYLSTQTFDKGRREIAMTLMEEAEHIRSGHSDETRAFQTHIFSQWLKSMEETNALFL